MTIQTQLPELNLTQPLDMLFEFSPLQNRLESAENPASRWLGQALAQVWYDFSNHLSKVPVVRAFEDRKVTRDQYMSYLRNMRQQVSQGGRWITRAASSMENSHVELRNALIRHAAEEHTDFAMLERDFVSMGGELEDIQATSMNIGSEALSAFIMNEATKANNVGIFGATFMIEGLGTNKASLWAEGIKEALNVGNESVSFLYYHGQADADHYENLINVLKSPYFTPDAAVQARRIAKVVGRLYALQLEELDNV
ncbi:iron-containing redox enzyme family protein [Pleionea sediminis]|uniref:iron-containing redox enzyme family protein n=1 Tax=Pleionea sediminis TaxID=2569479 RepID=UPI0013DE6DE1|nr:iron-containing redox enzyme family protein [Pleionea sediminis]